MQFGQDRDRLLLAQGESLRRGHACTLLFDGVQLGDALQGLCGQGTAAVGVSLEEFASNMSQASQFDRATG
jgi:hypothetical protein